MITQKLIHELFYYREDGNLIWKRVTHPRIKVGTIAGTKNKRGYCAVSINKKLYKVHKIIYIYHYGIIDSDLEIDHIYNNPSNNKITNLRIVTSQENKYNRKHRGYHWVKNRKRWRSRIMIGVNQYC